MNLETKRSVRLSFGKNLQGGVRTAYRSNTTPMENEHWPEITSALSIEGLLFTPSVRDQYILRRRPIIRELFTNHLTNLCINDSSNSIPEAEDEGSRIFCFDHVGKKFETSITWSIDDPLTFSRILHDVRNANFVTASIQILCSDSFFDLSDSKFAETDEYGELEIYQHKINIKRIDLIFQ